MFTSKHCKQAMAREKTKIISARITEDQFRSLESLAKRRGVSTSTLLNDCVNQLIGGEIKPSVGTVTEEGLQEILGEHLDQLKRDLLEELKQQQSAGVKIADPHPAPTDPGKNAKPKQQRSTPSGVNGISGLALSKRLGCGESSVRRWRQKGNDILMDETRKRDPDGKAWQYDPETTMYVEADA